MLDLRAQFESIAPEIRAAVDDVLTSQRFVLGPQGEAFEREIAEASGTRYGVGLASGTDALELGLHACGVKAGDEVIVPVFTFIATGSAVSALGARPVFADIEPATFNLDPDEIEARITPRTRAIVVVHLFGLAADMDSILAVAEKHGIPVIEDNAQSFGATYRGRKTGSDGAPRLLQFLSQQESGAYGDAGMIVTSEKLAARLRALRNHGQTGQYLSTERGWNSRLDELQAAILRVKLRHLADWTARRQEHARLYDSLLKDLPGIMSSARAARERAMSTASTRFAWKGAPAAIPGRTTEAMKCVAILFSRDSKSAGLRVWSTTPCRSICNRSTLCSAANRETCASASAPREKCFRFPFIPR